jgi:gliding motility-associated protein GldM
MIGLMYIVFLALVALNVAGEVLTAFDLVNMSMKNSVKNATARTKVLYGELESQYKVNENKVGPAYRKSKTVKEETNKIIDYLEDIKKQMVVMADGPDGDVNNIVKKDNLDAGPELMLGIPQKGVEMKNNLKEYSKKIKDICQSDQVTKEIDRLLDLENKKITAHGETTEKTWESYMFDHMPLIACITMLTNTQSNIKSIEGEAVKHLVNSVTAEDMNFSEIEAVVTTDNNYILRGSEFKAKIFLAAYDKNNPVEVYVNGSTKKLPIDSETGKGLFSAKATSLGKKNIKGQVKLQKLDGSYITREFKYQYTVGERGLVVSPTKMNVMYLGVDNPLEISVPGVPNNKISVSMTNAKYKKVGDGAYLVQPLKVNRQVEVFVSADLGKKEKMGVRKFRVKEVPDPKAQVAGKTFGNISKAELLAQMGVVAVLENFVFDLKFVVKRFTISSTIAGFSSEEKSTSYKFTKKQKALIKRLKRKSKLYIEDIFVVGPDGAERQLPAISLKVI